MDTKIDREQWSEESKRSYAYHCQAAAYEDIHYMCSKCGAASVFTAQDQKVSFEQEELHLATPNALSPVQRRIVSPAAAGTCPSGSLGK